MLLKVAWKSLLNRKITVLLTVLSVALGVFTLLGVEHIRSQAKSSFTSSVSGTDLIIGARTSPINLLLYSVFRIGNATNNISWHSYQHFAEHPQVAWSIPIALGDSHRGYRVMGTTNAYFRHFRYGNKHPLAFAQGGEFDDAFAVVLGAEVARRLNYQTGDKLVLAHGLGHTSFSKHEQNPFTVSGVLQTTGTPVDQTVHVPLSGLAAIHQGDNHGDGDDSHDAHAHDSHNSHDSRAGHEQHGHDDQHHHEGDLHQQVDEHAAAQDITAFMVGLTSKAATFAVQRQINDYQQEPLTAILPGVAMTQLWQMMGSVEKILQLISLLVFMAAMLGLSAMLMASMRERRREMAVLRAIGAGPGFIFLLLQAEALLMVIAGTILAIACLQLGLPLAQTALMQHFGLIIEGHALSASSLKMLTGVLLTTVVIGLVPSISAYRQSLHGGLVQRT